MSEYEEAELERIRMLGESDSGLAFLYQSVKNLFIIFDYHLPPLMKFYVNECFELVRERTRPRRKVL